MKKYVDDLGREWEIRVDIGSARELKEQLSFDFDSLLSRESPMLVRLTSDMFFVAQMLELLCRRHIAKAGLTDRDFAEGLRGEAFECAHVALLEEITDFFPKPQQRHVLGEILDYVRTASTKVMDAAATKIHQLLEQHAATQLPTLLTTVAESSVSSTSTEKHSDPLSAAQKPD